jgi:hypothetical protein
MSVTTICQVCENAMARHTCESCGATVCTDHYERAAGLCTHCAGGTRMGD